MNSPCLSCGALDAHESDCTRRSNVAGRTTSARWRRLSKRLRKQVGACEQCGATDNLTVDHLWPVSTHPEFEWDQDWLRVLCRSCNSRRGNKPPTDEEVRVQRLLIAARPRKPRPGLRSARM